MNCAPTDSQQIDASVGTPESGRKPTLTAKIDCTEEVTTAEIDYTMVCAVITSWDRKIMLIPDWSRTVGERFLRHIFRIDPKTISIFGFPPETKWDEPSLSEDENFVQKGIKLVKAIDTAIVYLGPDLEPFKEELFHLGWQHTAMKALPSHWPIVGEALLSALEDCMIGGISDVEREAWVKIYRFMAFHMIKGLTAHYKKSAGAVAPLKQDAESVPVIEVARVPDRSHRQELKRSSLYQQELRCDKHISPEDISFTVVTDVITCWQMITSIPLWDKVVGDLFLRYIFKIEPATIELFGFPSDIDCADPDLSNNMKFVTKGVVLIKAIDMVVQLLGPDLYPLQEVLFDLGTRHVHMKAQPEFWPVVGEALFLVFEERLGARFHDNFRAAWRTMYNFLGYHMIQGLTHQYKEIEEKV